MSKVLGLDIGIVSVEWGLIDIKNNKIIDMGVRLFDSAFYHSKDLSYQKTKIDRHLALPIFLVQT